MAEKGHVIPDVTKHLQGLGDRAIAPPQRVVRADLWEQGKHFCLGAHGTKIELKGEALHLLEKAVFLRISQPADPERLNNASGRACEVFRHVVAQPGKWRHAEHLLRNVRASFYLLFDALLILDRDAVKETLRCRGQRCLCADPHRTVRNLGVCVGRNQHHQGSVHFLGHIRLDFPRRGHGNGVIAFALVLLIVASGNVTGVNDSCALFPDICADHVVHRIPCNSVHDKVDDILQLRIPAEHRPLQGQGFLALQFGVFPANQGHLQFAHAVVGLAGGGHGLARSGVGWTDRCDLAQRLLRVRCTQGFSTDDCCEVVKLWAASLHALLIHGFVRHVQVPSKGGIRTLQPVEELYHLVVLGIDAPLLKEGVQANPHAQGSRAVDHLLVLPRKSGANVPKSAQSFPHLVVAAVVTVLSESKVVCQPRQRERQRPLARRSVYKVAHVQHWGVLEKEAAVIIAACLQQAPQNILGKNASLVL
mmetsp:Transcript_566/g.1640  ORF Transcript_566/g.1640 Transcript_566/m.1640 type:complete len:477 (-) Transcript_566:291-1721(-)